jgi:hypothetical protein
MGDELILWWGRWFGADLDAFEEALEGGVEVPLGEEGEVVVIVQVQLRVRVVHLPTHTTRPSTHDRDYTEKSPECDG